MPRTTPMVKKLILNIQKLENLRHNKIEIFNIISTFNEIYLLLQADQEEHIIKWLEEQVSIQ